MGVCIVFSYSFCALNFLLAAVGVQVRENASGVFWNSFCRGV